MHGLITFESGAVTEHKTMATLLYDSGVELDEQVSALIHAAAARLLRDVDQLRPEQPAVIYALVTETHKAIISKWRADRPLDLTVMLNGLLEEITNSMRRCVYAVSPSLPENGYMFGAAESSIIFELQADILLEEVKRIERELKA